MAPYELFNPARLSTFKFSDLQHYLPSMDLHKSLVLPDSRTVLKAMVDSPQGLPIPQLRNAPPAAYLAPKPPRVEASRTRHDADLLCTDYYHHGRCNKGGACRSKYTNNPATTTELSTRALALHGPPRRLALCPHKAGLPDAAAAPTNE